MLETYFDFISKGGFVMIPLLFMSLILCYQLYIRSSLFWSDRRRSESNLYFLFSRDLNLFSPSQDINFLITLKLKYKMHSTKYSDSVKMICRTAPLLGLLGTVSGMILTFDFLSADYGLIVTENISEGISQALISTQMGLLIAIPGLIMSRILDRKMQKYQDFIEAKVLETKEIS